MAAMQTGDPSSPASPPRVWCEVSDLERYSDDVRQLLREQADGSDGFLAERSDATDRLMERIISRYAPRVGRVLVRQNTMDPIIGGFDVPSPTAVAPSPATIACYLKDGHLIVERLVREMTAMWAIAEIIDRQLLVKQHAYQGEADRFRARFEALFRDYQAQIDTDGDGVADMLVDRSIIFLPPGTAS